VAATDVFVLSTLRVLVGPFGARPSPMRIAPLKLRLALTLAPLAALPLTTLATAAHAQEHVEVSTAVGHAPESEGRLPLAQAERPLTLPKFILNPEVEFNVTAHPSGDGVPSATFVNLNVSASFGVTDDLSVRATVLPLQLSGPTDAGSSAFHYGQYEDNVGPSGGATYRFLKGDVELGGSLDLSIITREFNSGVAITPGVPVRIHASKKIRIDTGAYLPITRSSPSGGLAGLGAAADPGLNPLYGSKTGLTVPVSALYDITEPLHVGLATALQIKALGDAGHSTAVPLGVFAGYAIEGKEGPILDIDPFVTFPGLIAAPDAYATERGEVIVGVGVGGFLYL
jgi:hypothetical protein